MTEEMKDNSTETSNSSLSKFLKIISELLTGFHINVGVNNTKVNASANISKNNFQLDFKKNEEIKDDNKVS